MNFEDIPESKPVFDEPAVKAVFAETGLPLAQGRTIRELGDSLEDIARQHYWNEFHPPDPDRESDIIRFDAIADASVTPSRLKYRLIAIEQSSKRVFAGSSRRPLAEKLEELLKRLGRHKNGSPMTHSGTGGRRCGRAPGGRGSPEIRGSTPCKANYPCTAVNDAEPRRAAGSRAGRRRSRKAVVECMAESRQEHRWAIRTPSSTDASRPMQLPDAARFRICSAI